MMVTEKSNFAISVIEHWKGCKWQRIDGLVRGNYLNIKAI
jgi:hypothetical protein